MTVLDASIVFIATYLVAGAVMVPRFLDSGADVTTDEPVGPVGAFLLFVVLVAWLCLAWPYYLVDLYTPKIR